MTTRGNQTGHELPGSESITYNPGYSDEGSAPERDPLLEPGRGQDLSQREKTTLGNYLNGLTSGRIGFSSPNSFTVPGGSNNTDGSGHSVSSDASSNQGPALTLAQMRSAGTTNGTFSDLTQALNKSAARKFQDTKNSEYGSGNNPFKDTDIKNFDSNARRRGQDGNLLLTSIQAVGEGQSDLGDPRVGPPPETTTPLQRKISEVIRNNRFNPIEKPFVQNKTRTDTGYTIQKQMGKYDTNAYTVSEAGLSSVGINVMLSAAGTPDGKSLLPGIPIINTADMRAQSVDVAGTRAQSPSDPDENERSPLLRNLSPYRSFSSSEYTNDSTTRDSYGNMNSPIEPFSTMGELSDTRNLLVISGAVLTVYGIVSIFEAKKIKLRQRIPLAKINVGVDLENPLAQDSQLVGSSQDFAGVPGYNLTMGKRSIKSGADNASNDGDIFIVSSIIDSFIDRAVRLYERAVPETEYFFGDCILRGSSILLNEIRVQSSGYVSSLARTVSRGTFSATNVAVQSIASSFSSLANIIRGKNFLNSLTSAFSSINQLLSQLEAFFSSSLFRFIAVLAQIGDRSLIADREAAERKEYSSGAVHVSAQASRLSDFNLSPNINDLGSSDKNSLAWKHSSSPSMYALPAHFRDAVANYAAINTKFIGMETDRFRRLDNQSSQLGRIHKDRVRDMENELEAEYMPFYFHDIRTNEIISFHAFLADLSDGFTAAYDNISGYGRVDDIMLYKNTKRSISLSFYVVATSIEDLDVMYWNINKLVTMLYPQYSRGRAMKSGNDRFIQPFSQIPTASPLIRLRIGDVIKSNYSKFGIARLFGLGQPESVFSPRPVMSPSQVVTEEETVAPPTPPPPGLFSVGQIITIKPGIPTRNRFLNSAGDGTETVRSQLSAQQDPAAQQPDAPTPATPRQIQRVPVIPRAIRTIPSGTRARILSISVVGGKLIYKCDIIRLSITSSSNTRTVEVASTPIASRTSPPSPNEYMTSPNSTMSYGPAEFDPYQNSNYSFEGGGTNPDGNMSVPIAMEQQISTGGQSFAGPTTRINFLRRIRPYHFIDLEENEIVRPRVRASRENSNSSTATNDTVTTTPRVPVAPAPPAPDAKNLSDFLSSESGGNPVIRSFESTRGRGLAGFITDIKFDWNEATWEIDTGNKAPKFMKVNISFSPIHDIPMGLDSDLSMRSVAYNVGGLSKAIADDPYSGDSED